jgi:hypothetical protein
MVKLLHRAVHGAVFLPWGFLGTKRRDHVMKRIAARVGSF